MTTEAAARLVALYPDAWRNRYGEEFTHVLIAQPLTLRLAVDVIGGAIDARLSGGTMTTNLMTRCAAGGPHLTTGDYRRATFVIIGASLAFSALYALAKLQLANNDMVDAFGIMAFPAALLVSMPFTYLKGTSRATQAAIVAGCLLLLAAVSYLTALI